MSCRGCASRFIQLRHGQSTSASFAKFNKNKLHKFCHSLCVFGGKPSSFCCNPTSIHLFQRTYVAISIASKSAVLHLWNLTKHTSSNAEQVNDPISYNNKMSVHYY